MTRGFNIKSVVSFSCLVVGLLAGCSTDQPAVSAEPGKTAASRGESAAKKKHRNRLADETSPYLLQHAHNPVDWYPWGDEALAKAKQENKLIFLSVGYSSCHWCHVMERESFMDDEIAALLNEHFVCIKVDREERPDIDSIYMTAVQIITGRGGWPMSVFLAPDAKPFFGGTYFPARDGDRGNATGFLTIVQRVQEIWKETPDKVRQSAEQLAGLIKQQLDGRQPVALAALDRKLLDSVQAALAGQFDDEYGGFGFNPTNPQQPKFPEPSNLVFLIERVKNDDDAQAREMLVTTLERMAMGGIRDHLGGGFHRYSVDRFWRIPHFEKMLYDNGQLASVYTEAYLLAGREDFRRVVREMLDFVLREMTSEEGGFYSAIDADSEHEEGKFYRWEQQEVEEALDEDQFDLFAEIYGLDGLPNFEGHFYAPQLSKPLAVLANQRGLAEEQLESQLDPIRRKLFDVRSKRIRPLTDTKILTGWNGLMIRGLADAGRGLEDRRYIEAAERAADFVLQNLRTEQGRLLRTYGRGHAKLNAYLDDYAFLVDGLIALHRATGEAKWLQAADQLTELQIELFWDDRHGGFFFTSDDHESLLARGKNPVDGAIPSGNSVSAENLVYLARELNKPEYLDRSEQTIRAASGLLQNAPAAVPRLAVALEKLLAEGKNTE